MNPNFSHNYYSTYKTIDFNTDGFADHPFNSYYFVDNYTLFRPFENYYYISNYFLLNSNYGYDSNNSVPNGIILGSEWQGLAIMYFFISFSPLLAWLVLKKKFSKMIND